MTIRKLLTLASRHRHSSRLPSPRSIQSMPVSSIAVSDAVKPKIERLDDPDPRFLRRATPHLAHFTDPMIFKGTKDRSAQQLQKGIEKEMKQIWGHGQFSPSHLNKAFHAGRQVSLHWFSGAPEHHMKHARAQFHQSSLKDDVEENKTEEAKVVDESDQKVFAFSPLEGSLVKGRTSGLANESLKLKRLEISQKVTYALIPALLLVSKTPLTTSLLIFSVFWQVYAFFKEIFLDYVHQEVTRTWVLIYFKLFLLIVAKDMFLYFGLV